MLDRTEPSLLIAPPETDWQTVLAASVPALVLARPAPIDPAVALAAIEGCSRQVGTPDELQAAIRFLPPALAADIDDLVRRFAALTGKPTVRLRLEAVDGDACRKFHADYTDLRLVSTYAGPGTDICRTPADDAPVHRIGTGDVALFKGKLFPGAPPVLLHRSPPIEGTGDRRVVLVLDTADGG
jgi:hypothetical protein